MRYYHLSAVMARLTLHTHLMHCQWKASRVDTKNRGEGEQKHLGSARAAAPAGWVRM